MSSKASLTRVIVDHYGTLVDQRTQRVSRSDVALMFVLPLLVGGACAYFDVHIVAAGQVLEGMAILGGFMFGLLTFVFQLRLQASNDPRLPSEGGVHDLLDELFANVAYTTLVAFATVASVMAPLVLGLGPEVDELGRWWSAMVVALVIHFGFHVAMCIKRTQTAYLHTTKR